MAKLNHDTRPEAGTVSHVHTPALLSAVDTARYLAISQRTLATLTASGEVPSLTIGRRRVYPRVALDQWIAERITTAGGAS
jgi:excisionase family DNA binding protein